VDIAAWFQELRRRRVIRALLAWGLFSFAILQVVEPLQHALGLADWVLKAVVAVLAIGFPVTAGLAWASDLTRKGIERTTPPEGEKGGASAPRAGACRRLGRQDPGRGRRLREPDKGPRPAAARRGQGGVPQARLPTAHGRGGQMTGQDPPPMI